ncbi:hypothetical protein IJ101_02025 [Candidatus Saccharibacteria bacterium]|nr:hypothetical protein [Candidatus Saccharibacteria bacterium]
MQIQIPNQTRKKGLSSYFALAKLISRAGLLATFLLPLVFAATVFPLYTPTDSSLAADGKPVESTITLSTSHDTTTTSMDVDAEGIFVSSAPEDEATFSITTDNYTGYTLGVSADNDDGTLVNESNDSLASIDSSLAADSFNSSENNGKWGFRPSRYQDEATNAIIDNTGDGAVYLPSPTTAATTLDVTDSANNEANTYTIGLGARADYTKASGEYTKTFILVATGNPVGYSISFNPNTTDEIENFPEPITSSTPELTVALPSTAPSRALYEFDGWCLGTVTTSNFVDTCNGEVFQAGDTISIDQTASNIVNLTAMWSANTVTITKQYRLETASGTWGEYIVEEPEIIVYGSPYTYTKTMSGYRGDSANDSAATITIAEATTDQTLSLDLYRNTYTLSMNYNTTYIASISGAGTYRWGVAVPVSATYTSTGEFLAWSQTAGTTGSFGNTAAASTTFTMPQSNATIYANGQILSMQNLPSGRCPTTGATARDTRDNNQYLVRQLPDGRCWLQDNLRLNLTSVSLESLKGRTNATDQILTYLKNGGGSAPNASTGVRAITSGAGSYNVPNIVNSQINTTTTVYGSGSNKVGVYYNFCAASAGSYCYGSGSGSGSISNDICPSGWRLPTINEYTNLYNKTGTSNFRREFSVLWSGNYWSGNGGVHGIGSFMYVWASDYYSTDYRYTINVTNEGNYRIPDNDNRSRAITVRCILK